MKVPHLILPERSKFYPLIREALKASGNQLPVNLLLGKGGGYDGACVVHIETRTENDFESTMELSDPTRFPARIRAACTALRDTGLLGGFHITHQDGQLTIEAA